MLTGAETRETNSPICGNALGRVGGGDHGDAGLIGKGVGGEGLLREGGADDGDDVPVDQGLEGVDGALLVAGRVLEDEGDGGAADAALVVIELLRQLGAVDLFLAKEGDVAGFGDGDADRDAGAGGRVRLLLSLQWWLWQQLRSQLQ